MQAMEFSKDVVHERLKGNLAKHKRDHEEARQGWKKLAIVTAREYIAAVDAGKEPHFVQHPAPRSHEDEYETAIEMIAYSLGETVMLSPKDFERYMLDKWEWKREFEHTNTIYSGRQ